MGDEPFAAQTGAAILAQGGSAADAVTAMFFTLTATYPVAAGLGGGGICLVRDAGQGEFGNSIFCLTRAKAAAPMPCRARWPVSMIMQKAFGALPWQRDVAPGEAYAATGFPISHVLASGWPARRNCRGRIRRWRRSSWTAPAASSRKAPWWRTPRCPQTLSAIRLAGADGFYKGAVADSDRAARRPGRRRSRPANFLDYRTGTPDRGA